MGWWLEPISAAFRWEEGSTLNKQWILKMLVVGKSPAKFIWLIKMQFNSSSEKYTEVNAHLTMIWYCTTVNVTIIKLNYSSTPDYMRQKTPQNLWLGFALSCPHSPHNAYNNDLGVTYVATGPAVVSPPHQRIKRFFTFHAHRHLIITDPSRGTLAQLCTL